VERQTITIEEIADILGIHKNTAYRAAKRDPGYPRRREALSS
jgi:hypothetical protein